MIFCRTRNVKPPTRGTQFSAGLDFYIPNDMEAFVIKPGESVNIPSGIKMVIDPGFAGIFFNKSGVGVKGIIVGACVVDSDYRGEVHLNVHNTSNKEVAFQPGQKLVQMLVMPVDLSEPISIGENQYELLYSNTERGTGGFGSTGV